MPSTILNVLDFRAVPDLPPNATREELEKNRQCIQDTLNAILPWGSGIDSDAVRKALSPSSPLTGTVVRFPMGVYRIYGKLQIPFRQCFVISGDGGLGGTVIVQHKQDEPIFEFQNEDTWGWTIENLCFTWQIPQTYRDEHSVAIHFFQGQSRYCGFYCGVIRQCKFANAFRGIGITPWQRKFSVEADRVEDVLRELRDSISGPKLLPVLSAMVASQLGSRLAVFAAAPKVVETQTSHCSWTVRDTEPHNEDRVWRIIVWQEKEQENEKLNVYLDVPLPVWMTHIDHCWFSGCTDTAVRLTGNCGMGGNVISNTFIENNPQGLFNLGVEFASDLDAEGENLSARVREKLDAGLRMKYPALALTSQARREIEQMGRQWAIFDADRKYLIKLIEGEKPSLWVYYDPENVGAQLLLSAQSGMSLTSLDMEGSTSFVINAESSTIAINGLSLEHLRPKADYAWLLYLADLSYDIHGLSLCGWEVYKKRQRVFVIVGGNANIVVSGIQMQFKPDPYQNQDKTCFYLFGGPSARSYRLLGQIVSIPEGKLQLCPQEEGTVQRVTADPIKVRQELTFACISSGHAETAKATVPGACPGDIVGLGPPANLTPGLLAFGCVHEPGTVEVRLLNATADSIAPDKGIWTITTGGGPPHV